MQDIKAVDNHKVQVDSAIKAALEATLPEHGEIDWNVALSSAAGLDSVQIMNLVMEIEDTLDISVPVDVLADAHTLNELASKLVGLVQAKP